MSLGSDPPLSYSTVNRNVKTYKCRTWRSLFRWLEERNVMCSKGGLKTIPRVLCEAPQKHDAAHVWVWWEVPEKMRRDWPVVTLSGSVTWPITCLPSLHSSGVYFLLPTQCKWLRPLLQHTSELQRPMRHLVSFLFILFYSRGRKYCHPLFFFFFFPNFNLFYSRATIFLAPTVKISMNRKSIWATVNTGSPSQ